MTVSAEPAEGYFNHWAGDLSGTSKTETITVDSDMNVIAHFTKTGEEGGELPMIWIGMGIVIIILAVVVSLVIRRKS